MQRVTFYASHDHYLDHLAPIWLALPRDRRGTFYVHQSLKDRARALGVAVQPVANLTHHMVAGTEPVCVASWGNVLEWRHSRRPIILLNHGAGQTYNVSHPSYAGGRGRERVGLFLEPGPHAAEATRAAYPKAKVVEIGCPKLDARHALTWERHAEPVIAFSTHWECRVTHETRSSWPHFGDALLALPGNVIAHAHPKIRARVRAAAEAAGVEFVETFDEVLDRADLYICDNSSTLYEFASTGRPVVCLNPPWYRRSVEHGLRFWDAVPGIECDDPSDLPKVVARALRDPQVLQRQRERAVARAYVACDGQAAQRAAAAIVHFMEAGR